MTGDNVGNGPRTLLLMGPSGSGKTTIARLLATSLECEFIDADDYHSAQNIKKMGTGLPLTDEDRVPWLRRLNELLHAKERTGDLVLACSALKHAYQDTLSAGPFTVKIIFLSVPRPILEQRLRTRSKHFAGTSLLTSQLETLEPPTGQITIDATGSPLQVRDHLLQILTRQ